MKYNALGLACLASLAAPVAMALDTDLAIADRDAIDAGAQLLNKHWSHGAIHSDDVTSNLFADARWWDIGVHLDGFLAMEGDDVNNVTTFETTEVTGRLDYLFEVENIFQALPFFETTVYPNITGRAPYYWLGTDLWFMLPVEGVELGGSAQYNLHDDRDILQHEHHWLFDVGAREFWQDAPLDLAFWQVAELGSRSWHESTIGDTGQGLTTINIGAKATLPLPYEDLWAFLSVEGHWYVTKDERNTLKGEGRDSSELIIGIGFQYRSN